MSPDFGSAVSYLFWMYFLIRNFFILNEKWLVLSAVKGDAVVVVTVASFLWIDIFQYILPNILMLLDFEYFHRRLKSRKKRWQIKKLDSVWIILALFTFSGIVAVGKWFVRSLTHEYLIPGKNWTKWMKRNQSGITTTTSSTILMLNAMKHTHWLFSNLHSIIFLSYSLSCFVTFICEIGRSYPPTNKLPTNCGRQLYSIEWKRMYVNKYAIEFSWIQNINLPSTTFFGNNQFEIDRI